MDGDMYKLNTVFDNSLKLDGKPTAEKVIDNIIDNLNKKPSSVGYLYSKKDIKRIIR